MVAQTVRRDSVGQIWQLWSWACVMEGGAMHELESEASTWKSCSVFV